MFLDLVDALRCPRPHAPTWLVAASLESRGRCLVRGTLGCPVCEAEFPIADGIADFGDGSTADGADDARTDVASAEASDGELALRLAAFLDLATPGGIVAVGGAWDRALDPLLDLTDLRALVLEPGRGWRPREPFGGVRGGGVPVAAGALRGIALDARTSDVAHLAGAVRALAPHGRLLAPAAAPLPEGVRELARDATHWIAEREPGVVSEIVRLRRG